MKMTGKQAHVLENLERVQPLHYKVITKAPQRRFQLDGWECTPQITGLVVRQLVTDSSGRLSRTGRRA